MQQQRFNIFIQQADQLRWETSTKKADDAKAPKQYYNLHLCVGTVQPGFYRPFIKIKLFMGNGVL